MYNILMSKFNEGFSYIENELRKIVNENSKVVIIPWSFATELKTKNINEFFDDEKEKSYLEPLYRLGIDKNNIFILDCYKDTKEDMINIINKSDLLILTGGNPEMLKTKILESGLLKTLQNYKKDIIGSSAGAEIQLKTYFITKKNNYYKKFEWYKGLEIIDNDFYFDVHSINKGRYLPALKEKSIKLNKAIYCLFDTGSIIYNRSTKQINCYGKYIKYSGK